MPHQCLKCGCVYADGSPEILKGCNDCQGTRFFYTEEALGAEARSRLDDRTEPDVEALALGKGAPPGDREPARSRIPTKDELPVGGRGDTEDEWVRMTPNHLRDIVEDVVRRGSERKPRFRVGAPVARPDQSVGEWARGATTEPEDAPSDPDVGRRAEDLIESLLGADEETPSDRAARPPATPGATKAEDTRDDTDDGEVVYARSKRPVPPPMGLTPEAVRGDERPEPTPAERVADAIRPEDRSRPDAPSAKHEADSGAADDGATSVRVPESHYPEGTPPETIAIQDDGAYELDVKRLLEKNPLVVHKDGSYSLHLPSLMEMVDKKPRR